jgi:hypothetical protein
MATPLLEKVTRINAHIGGLLNEARQSLRGECIFGVAQVRSLSADIAEMAPVWAQASALRVQRPEMTDPLDLYKSQLRDLSMTLCQVRMMLLTQRSQMEANRAQLAAVGHWAEVFQKTR